MHNGRHNKILVKTPIVANTSEEKKSRVFAIDCWPSLGFWKERINYFYSISCHLFLCSSIYLSDRSCMSYLILSQTCGWDLLPRMNSGSSSSLLPLQPFFFCLDYFSMNPAWWFNVAIEKPCPSGALRSFSFIMPFSVWTSLKGSSVDSRCMPPWRSSCTRGTRPEAGKEPGRGQSRAPSWQSKNPPHSPSCWITSPQRNGRRLWTLTITSTTSASRLRSPWRPLSPPPRWEHCHQIVHSPLSH